MNQIIERLGIGQFRISWEGLPDSIINLDFNPILKEFSLYGHLAVLEHWQAKPLTLRRWGLYCIATDNYYSVEYDKYRVSNGIQIRSLQVLDSKYSDIRPTAVKLYANAKVRQFIDGTHIIS